MPLFLVGSMNSSTSAMLYVRAPRLKQIASTDIEDWRKFFSKKSRTCIKKRSKQYENCLRLLSFAQEFSKIAKVTSVYNFPCRGGNQLGIVLEFGSSDAKKNFIERLSELEDEASYST